MTNVNTPYNTETSVKLIVPNISKLNQVTSPEYLISGTPWKLNIHKKAAATTGNKHTLAIYLHCALQNRPADWSHAVRTEIKILPSDGSRNQVPLEHYIQPFVFRSDDTGFGSNSLVSWEYLFKSNSRYVKDDKITLDVRIIAEDKSEPKRSALDFNVIGKTCDDGCISMFRLKVSNITNLMAVRSPQFRLGKCLWDLTVFKHRSHAGVRLMYSGHEELPHEIVMTATLMSTKEKKIIEQTGKMKPGGILQALLAPWEELIDPKNRFINDNSIVIEVEVKKSGLKVSSCSTIGSNIKCPICFEALQLQEISATKCGHIFCSACIRPVIRAAKPCPMCNTAVSLDDLLRIYLPL